MFSTKNLGHNDKNRQNPCYNEIQSKLEKKYKKLIFGNRAKIRLMHELSTIQK